MSVGGGPVDGGGVHRVRYNFQRQGVRFSDLITQPLDPLVFEVMLFVQTALSAELANGGDPDEKETCALHGQVNVYESQNKSALQHGHRTRQHGHWRRGTRRFRWHRLCV